MMSSWRVAARLSRREVRHRPGRTALVALLVAVPVAGMLVAVVLHAAVPLTVDRSNALTLGQADLLVQGGAVDVSKLPAGSDTVVARVEPRRIVDAAGEAATIAVADFPLVPVTEGIVRVDAGRAPQASTEALVSPGVADTFGLHVGGALRLDRPTPMILTVTGIGAVRGALDQDLLIVGPSTAWPWRDAATTQLTFVGLPPGSPATPQEVVADQPGSPSWARWDGVGADLFAGRGTGAWTGFIVASRHLDAVPEQGDYGRATTFAVIGPVGIGWAYVFGAVAATVTGIVITAAFAVGGRRQLTMLGQLAASGASPRHLRRMLVLQGTWTGVVGVIVGMAVGWVVLWVGRGPLEQRLDRVIAPYDVRWGEIAPIVAIGLVAATIGALVPAVRASRLSVLASLGGRRPVGRVPTWMTVGGIASIAVGLLLLGTSVAVTGRAGTSGEGSVAHNGALWVLVAVVGSMATLLGTCALTPAYVTVLEPLARRLRGSWRLAARSLARQRTRTGAVVAAVAATAALAVLASSLYLGDDAKQQALNREWQVAEVAPRPPVGPQPAVMATVPAGSASSPLVAISPLDGRRDDLVHLHGTPLLGGPSSGATPLSPVPTPDPEVVIAAEAVVHPVTSLVLDTVTASDGSRLDWVLTPAISAGRDGHIRGSGAVVATPEVLDLYALSDEDQGELAVGGVLAVGSWLGEDPASLSSTGLPLTIEVPTSATSVPLLGMPQLLVTSERAADLGLRQVPGDVVLVAPGPITASQASRLRDLQRDALDQARDAAFDGPAVTTEVTTHRDLGRTTDGPVNALALQGIFAALVLAICLLVIAMNLWLAAAESRDERDLLEVVGASPATLRRTSSHKAVLLAGLGTVLAIPLGFLPAVVVSRAMSPRLPVVFPWAITALLVVVVPAVAYLVTSAGSSLRVARSFRRRSVALGATDRGGETLGLT